MWALVLLAALLLVALASTPVTSEPEPSLTDGGGYGATGPSPQAYSLIRAFEGLHLTAYPDGTGYSIGYGHHGALPGDVITHDQADRYLDSDVQEATAAITSQILVPLTQGQFDALVSFVYNVGVDAFTNSTLVAKLNAGDVPGAAEEFARWVYAGGQVSAGLQSRRARERGVFLS